MDKKRMQEIDHRVNEIISYVEMMNINPDHFKKEEFDKFNNILEVMEVLYIIKMKRISDTQFAVERL